VELTEAHQEEMAEPPIPVKLIMQAQEAAVGVEKTQQATMAGTGGVVVNTAEAGAEAGALPMGQENRAREEMVSPDW